MPCLTWKQQAQRSQHVQKHPYSAHAHTHTHKNAYLIFKTHESGVHSAGEDERHCVALRVTTIQQARRSAKSERAQLLRMNAFNDVCETKTYYQ